MERTRLVFIVVITLFLLGMGFMSTISDDQYILISVVLVIASMLPFFIRFEMRALHAREIVIIAMMAAIAGVSRVPFAMLPSVQPTSFVIIVAALVFGAESGFMIGAFAALVSNMFLGQGPWTPWQMFAWGMIGFTAGLMGRWGWLERRWVLLLFGLIWGFLFGWIMNFWIVSGMFPYADWSSIAAIYSASFYFDLAHALSNVFFLALFTTSWVKVMQRFKRKYGLLS
jgi:energy-coupling factor transport system substrate-specific component